MDHPPQLPDKIHSINPFWFLLWGFLAGLLAALLVAGAILLLRMPLKKIAVQPTVNPIPDAYVFIEVGVDGCGVERSEVTGSNPVTNLTWVVVDEDGYIVLERSADNEYKYRYFNSGNYSVHINAWYEGRYHQISNEVDIDC